MLNEFRGTFRDLATGTGDAMIAARDDDQFRGDTSGLKFLVQVRGMLKRDNVVLVTVDLHDRWVVFADK